MERLKASIIAKVEERPLDTILTDGDDVDYTYVKNKSKNNFKVPDKFDGTKVWSGLLTVPKNQGTCSSCWAFATVSTLADRFNIQSMGQLHIELSPSKLILCDARGKEFDIEHPETDIEKTSESQYNALRRGACFGNSLYDAWRYLFTIGTNTLQCIPYNKGFGQYKQYQGLGSFNSPVKMPLCTTVSGPIGDMCSDYVYDEYSAEEHGTPAKFYRAFHFYALAGIPKDGGSEYNIRYEIFRWGPVSAGMDIYPNFYTFDAANTIYEWDNVGPLISGHAVEIVGWGEENSKKYWLIKNSWGAEWGINGYFKMIRGVNNCRIEENIITGIPDFFYPSTYKMGEEYIWAESKDAKDKQQEINFKLISSGGGIDPETGYTRRVMVVYPSLDLTKPVKFENLPKWDKWVAGIDATISNRVKFQSTIENINRGTQVTYVVGFILFILVIMLLLILFKHYGRKYK